MDFRDKLRALVLAQLALANRDPEQIAAVVDGLVEMLGAAVVIGYRDDRLALDQACTALEGLIHQSAVTQVEKLKAFGFFDDDREP